MQKRRVSNKICFRELRLVKRSTEDIAEYGLGAVYSDYICIGYIGVAR